MCLISPLELLFSFSNHHCTPATVRNLLRLLMHMSVCRIKIHFFWPKYFTRLHTRGWDSDTSFLLIRSQFEIYIYYSYLNNIDKLLIMRSEISHEKFSSHAWEEFRVVSSSHVQLPRKWEEKLFIKNEP